MAKNTKFRISIRVNEVKPILLNVTPSDIDLFDLKDNINNLIQSTSLYEELSKSENYEEGLGYMSSPSDLSFGDFGKHGIYSNIPENTQLSISVKNSTGSSYWYHLTDVNNNILESQHSNVGNFILNFGKYNQITKLYVSVQGNYIVNKLSDVFINEQISKNVDNIRELQEQVIVIEETKTELSKSNNYEEGQGYMSKPSSLEFGSFGKHGIYSNIPENTIIRVEVTSSIGSAYYYHLTDEEDNILETIHSIGSVDVPEDFSHTFNSYNKVTKLYISIQGQQTVVSKIETKSYSIKDKLSNLEVEIDNLKNNIGNTYLSGLNVGIDGDSTTSEGFEGLGKSWPFYTNKVINFKSLKNIGMGNATLLDRTSNTSGTTYYPQWAPDVNEGWIDYWGLNDPNFAGDTGGKYESGTPEFDQATANNCLYGHIGYYISLVNKGKVPTPDIFILANAGVNDTWNFAQNNDKINTVLGTFDEAIAGNWGDIQRNTILKSIRWGIQKLRSEYPKCKIFFKTSVQQANRTHYGYYLTYEPIIKLLKYLSVPIIDSYSELGVQSDFEESEVASENHYTSDGTHPKSETYEIEGKFVASKLKTFFL